MTISDFRVWWDPPVIDGGLGRTHRRSSAHVPTSDGYQLPPQNILELVMLRAHTIGRLIIMLLFIWDYNISVITNF